MSRKWTVRIDVVTPNRMHARELMMQTIDVVMKVDQAFAKVVCEPIEVRD